MARLRRHLSYANVVSTIALAAALGMGGAYAVDRIGSREIKDNSIRSVDLRDGKAVRGVDVRRNSLGGRQIREESLVATRIAPVARDYVDDCELIDDEETSCAEAHVTLRRRGRIFAVATGSHVTDEQSEGVDHTGVKCHFQLNDVLASESLNVGEVAANTSDFAGKGFAFTFLSPGLPLEPGDHRVALVCEEVGGQVALENVSLVAVALSGR